MRWQICQFERKKKTTTDEPSPRYAHPDSDAPTVFNNEQTGAPSQYTKASLQSTSGRQSLGISQRLPGKNSPKKVLAKQEQTAEQEPAPNKDPAAEQKLTPAQERVDRLKHLENSNLNAGLWKEARKELDEDDLNRLEQFISLGDGNLQGAVVERLKTITESRLKIEVNGKKHNVREGAQKVLNTLRRFEPVIKAATAADSHASLAWGGISAFLPLLSTALCQTDNALTELEVISNILVKFRAIEVFCDLSEWNSAEPSHIRDCYTMLRSKTIELYTEILKHQIVLMRHYEMNRFSRMAKNMTLQPIGDFSAIQTLEHAAEEFLKTIDSSAIHGIDTALTLIGNRVDELFDLAQKSYHTILEVAERQLLEKLPKAESANFDSAFDGFKLPRCLEGTRQEVLDKFRHWAKCTDAENCVFWLSGMAGTGKSTIARTFAHELKDEGRLGASFFFSRGQEDLSRAGKFFPTLALGLAKEVAGFAKCLYESVRRNGGAEGKDFEEQWKFFIHDPLEDLGSSLLAPLQLVLVIDALDECKGAEAVPHLIDLLLAAKDLKTIQLRVLVTSRNETHILESFEGKSSFTWLSLEDESIADSTERDISIYVKHELSGLSGIVRRKYGTENWPEEVQTQRLLEFSGRLFIAAATVCRHLKSSSIPRERLETFLEAARTTKHGIPALDKMYRLILDPLLTEGPDQEEINENYKPVVGAILVSKKPISVSEMAVLFNLSHQNINLVLEKLTSFLIVPQSNTNPVRLYHLSFRDFLINKKRCGDERMFIDEDEAHRRWFHYCLEHLSTSLKKDICGLKHPGTLYSEVERDMVIQHIPRTVQYGCQYWALHLRDTNISSPGTTEVIKTLKFITTHLLHWIEALAMIGRIDDAVTGIVNLKIVASTSGEQEFEKFANDAHRFILYHRQVIEKAPLQVYYTASVFSPTESVVRNTFLEHYPAWIRKAPNTGSHWSAEEQILQCGSSVVMSAISFDGQMAACAAKDTITVWDVVTGKLKHTFTWECPNFGFGGFLIFSPDGHELTAFIASETPSRRKREVWSLITGKQIAALKDNGSHLPSLCDLSSWSWKPSCGDRQERVSFEVGIDNLESNLESTWNFDWGFDLEIGLEHTISADGTTMALFENRCVHIGNTQTRQIICTLNCYSVIDGIALSATRAAILLYHGIKIWDIANNCPVEGQIRGEQAPRNFALSSDGTRLACASSRTVEIWNLDFMRIEHVMEIPHTNIISSIALFPCATKVMVGLQQFGGALVWNIQQRSVSSGSSASDAPASKDPFFLSKDGIKLAIGQIGSRKYWDLIKDELILEPQALLQDGAMSFDGFDGEKNHDETEEWRQRHLGEKYKYKALRFSSDKTRILIFSFESHSYGFEVMSTVNARCEFARHRPCVNAKICNACLSHNSTKVALRFPNRIEVWDMNSEDRKEFKGHKASPVCMAFSPKDTRIAIGWEDNIVSIYNIATGETEQKLQASPALVFSLRFSPDDLLVEEPLYTVDRSVEWITHNQKRVLALPSNLHGQLVYARQHSPYLVEHRANSLAYRTESGRLAAFVFEHAIEIAI